MLEHNEEMDSEEEWDFESPSAVYVVEHDEEMESEEEWDFESLSAMYAVTQVDAKEEIDFDVQVEDECNSTKSICTVVIEPYESSFAGEAKLRGIGHVIEVEHNIVSVIENGQGGQDEVGINNRAQLQEKLGEFRKPKELDRTPEKRMLFAA